MSGRIDASPGLTASSAQITAAQSTHTNIDTSPTTRAAFALFQKLATPQRLDTQRLSLLALPEDVLSVIRSFVSGSETLHATCSELYKSQQKYATRELLTLLLLKHKDLIQSATFSLIRFRARIIIENPASGNTINRAQFPFFTHVIGYSAQYRFVIMHRSLYRQLACLYGCTERVREIFQRNGQPHLYASSNQVIYCHEFYLRLHEYTKTENYNLLKVWKCIANQLKAAPISYAGSLPFAPKEIRAWMQHSDHQVFLQQIVRLDLSRLVLRAVPPELNLLTRLEVLNLSENQLTQLLDGFGNNMPALQILHLQNNQLTHLPDAFGNGMPALQILGLQNNQLTQLPDAFGNGMPTLQMLYLQNNQLTQLPDAIENNTLGLTRLETSGNPVPLLQISN